MLHSFEDIFLRNCQKQILDTPGACWVKWFSLFGLYLHSFTKSKTQSRPDLAKRLNCWSFNFSAFGHTKNDNSSQKANKNNLSLPKTKKWAPIIEPRTFQRLVPSDDAESTLDTQWGRLGKWLNFAILMFWDLNVSQQQFRSSFSLQPFSIFFFSSRGSQSPFCPSNFQQNRNVHNNSEATFLHLSNKIF